MMNHDTTFDRRALLKLLSTSPLLWGSSLLAATQDPQEKTRRPTWFLAALRQARAREVPVVAVVVPDLTRKEIPTMALAKQRAEFGQRLRALCKAEPEANAGAKVDICRGPVSFTIPFEDRLSRLAVYLQLLLDSKDAAMQELFLDAVWVCAPASLAGAEQSETLVTLDTKGRRVGGAIVDLSNERKVVAKLQHLLHGNGKLEKRARAVRSPEVTAAFEALAGDDRDALRKAQDLLHRDSQVLMPAIIECRQQHRDGAVRRALGEIVANAFERAKKQGYQGILPFGTRLEQRQVYDPCPPCGMSRVPAGARKMLKLLGQ